MRKLKFQTFLSKNPPNHILYSSCRLNLVTMELSGKLLLMGYRIFEENNNAVDWRSCRLKQDWTQTVNLARGTKPPMASFFAEILPKIEFFSVREGHFQNIYALLVFNPYCVALKDCREIFHCCFRYVRISGNISVSSRLWNLLNNAPSKSAW